MKIEKRVIPDAYRVTGDLKIVPYAFFLIILTLLSCYFIYTNVYEDKTPEFIWEEE